MKEAPDLNEDELKILANRTFMPIKQSASEKLVLLLSQFQEDLSAFNMLHSVRIPDHILQAGSKISKGENHQSYAYRVLDYPSLIGGEDIFLFRTLVLWGHFVGFYLILKGKWKDHYPDTVLSYFQGNNATSLQVCLNEDPWNWKADETEHAAASETEALKRALQNAHLKLVRFMDLEKINNLSEVGLETWKEYLEVLGIIEQS